METKDLTLKVVAPGESHLYIFDDINESSASTFIKDLHKMHNELNAIENENTYKLTLFMGYNGVIRNDITINLCTPGGYCYHGLAIRDAIQNISAKRDVNIHATGFVCSMGIPILLSVPVEHRSATKDTTFMIHQVLGITLGKVQDLIESVEETKRIHDILWKIIKDNSKITEEQLKDCYDHKRDWFITAEEALELGLISKIV